MTKKPDMSQLSSHIGFWMRRVSNHISHAFARRLEALDVTVAEWVILREMYDGDEDASPSRVAELCGLSRGAVSKLISRLLEKGLVSRREAKEDRRFQDIRLTEKGKKLVPKLAKLADANDDESFSGLNANERKELKRLLIKLVDIHRLNNIPIA